MNKSDIKKIPVSSNPDKPTFFTMGVRDRQAFRMPKNTPEKDAYFLVEESLSYIAQITEETDGQIAFWFTTTDDQTHKAVFDVLDQSVEILN